MERRFFTVKEVRKIEKENGIIAYRFVASDESRDSHGTILPVDGWDLERYNSNGVVGYMHNVYGGDLCNVPDPDDVIGIGNAFIEGKELMIDIVFEPEDINPKAAKIEKKVNFGSLKAVSVGFNPIEQGKFGEGEEREGGANQTYYFGKRELLEVSVVNIPSNKNALKRNLRDNAYSALMFIHRELGEGYSFSQIEDMKVRDVLALISKGENREIDEASVDDNTIPDNTLNESIAEVERNLVLTEALASQQFLN